MAAAPAVIPYKLTQECTPDYRKSQYRGEATLVEQINLAIKSAARTITRTRLSDKVSSNIVLNRAGLSCLNEMVASASAVMVWKSKRFMDSLGRRFFSLENKSSSINTRSSKSDKIKIPVPGFPNLAVNLLATAWNENTNLRTATTLGCAKKAAKNWAKSLLNQKI